MLTIAIPIKQSMIKPDCLIRLWVNLCRLNEHPEYNNSFQILVADSSHYLVKPWVRFVSGVFKSNYCSVVFDKQYHYSPAYVKNTAISIAFQQKNVSHILFLDVDVLLADDFLDHVLKQVSDNLNFDWYPVNFLKKNFGLKAMLSCKSNVKFNNIKSEDVLQVGYVTGLQLLSRDFVKKNKGYDERFLGYGCEDIEMIHRATLVEGMRMPQYKDSSYYTDDRGYDASSLSGFRNYYYNLKINQDFKFIFPYHFWHKRHTKSKYLSSRQSNDKILIGVMQEFDINFMKNLNNII